MNRQHHAFVIEAGAEEGIAVARAWVERELGVHGENNPDILVLQFGLFSVADARRVCDLAVQAPIAGEASAIIISASRAYHEAQNALLKLFEEPPPHTFLFFILPSLGGLLPTLRSRVQILKPDLRFKIHEPKSTADVGHDMSHTLGIAKEFIEASREKRSAIIKKLVAGRDEDERRENRDEAIAILNDVEEFVYKKYGSRKPIFFELLREIAVLRGYLYDRSAPVKMILEHLSLTLPERSRLI